MTPADDPRTVAGTLTVDELGPGDYAYVRISTESGDMAWASPFFG